jgi:hypothetical protein
MSGRIFGYTFGRVPTWLLDAPVSDRAVRLFALLTRYADREGRGFPGRRALAERLHCSVDSIDRALRELVAAGAVRVEERWDVAGAGGQLTNDYYLVEHRQAEEDPGRTDATPPSRTGAASPSRAEAAPPAAPLRLLREREPEERKPGANETPPSFPRRGRGELVPDAIPAQADHILDAWAAAYRDRTGHEPTVRATRQLTREVRRLLGEERSAEALREAALLLVGDTLGARLLESRVDRVLMGRDGRPGAGLTGQVNPIDARIQASIRRAVEAAG